MRISTSMIFDTGVATINSQTAALLHLQQQVAQGRRNLTPADDPVNAARALEVTQASAVNAQFKQNHDNANSALGLGETQLSSTSDLLSRVHELAVEGGNGALTLNDRKAISFELRARFDELMGIANSTDGIGQYIFSGFMGTTKPFGGSVDNINAAAGNDVTYQGDDGQRRLQVSSTRFVEVSDSGNDVFRRIRNGNGYFVTNYINNTVTAQSNTGTAVIDGGSVTNPATWNALANKDYSISFSIDYAVQPPVTYYDVIDTTSGNSLLTGAPPVVALAAPPAAPAVDPLAPRTTLAGTGLRVFQSGQPIVLTNLPTEPAFDLGSSVLISGDPATGDSFSLAPSTSQSIFVTLAKLIGALEASNTAAAGGPALLQNDIGFALTDLNQAADNILRVRAQIGSRMNEVESLSGITEDLNLQYQQTLSNLQDLDYAKTLSDLTRKQIDLEAAQKSFVSSSGLSLFDYIR